MAPDRLRVLSVVSPAASGIRPTAVPIDAVRRGLHMWIAGSHLWTRFKRRM
jgi:hypothetical protein